MVLAYLAIACSAHSTAQIADTFIYKEKSYSLIGKTDGTLVHPHQFGMNPVMIHTACYRGFYATFELTEKSLLLKKLTLREKDRKYLPIRGVKPDINTEKHYATYTNLNIEVNFTGKIRLAKDFIKDLYIHMGYQKPTAFKTVLDITLREGKVVEIKDRSKEMASKRGGFKKRYESGEPIKTIKEAFSLDMKLE